MKTIRAKVLFIAFVAALLFCAVIIWLTLGFADKYRALITADCAATVDAEFEFIGNSLRLCGEQAKDLSRLGGVYYSLSKGSAPVDRNTIIENLSFQHDFIGGGIWFEPYAVFPDEKRHCFYVYSDGDTIIYDEAFEGGDYNYLQQQWYKGIIGQLRAGHDTAWFGPYVDEAGSYAEMMTVGSGIYDKSGNLVGVATADASIDFMKELLSDLQFTQGTVVTAVHEEIEAQLRGYTIREDTGQTIGFIRLFENGIRISVSIPTNELFSVVSAMTRNMAAIVVIILLVSFLVIYGMLNRLLNRPLAIISEKTREIGNGNLDTVIEIKNDDEIGQLGVTINKMTSDIRNYIENLSKVTRENERIQSELYIAAKIQREMLPELNTENEHYCIYAEMTPCLSVGGDFYDAFIIDDENMCVLIADVSGKGVPAALFMAKAITAVRAYAQTGLGASEIVEKVNRQLCEGNEARMFVTMFFGVINIKAGEFNYVNAGHCNPVIKRGEKFEYLQTERFIALGVLPTAAYNESVLKLFGGERVLMYTDGVTETLNTKSEAFGEERLLSTINRSGYDSLLAMTEGIKKELDTFADGAETHDDITMLSFEIL